MFSMKFRRSNNNTKDNTKRSNDMKKKNVINNTTKKRKNKASSNNNNNKSLFQSLTTTRTIQMGNWNYNKKNTNKSSSNKKNKKKKKTSSSAKKQFCALLVLVMLNFYIHNRRYDWISKLKSKFNNNNNKKIKDDGTYRIEKKKLIKNETLVSSKEKSGKEKEHTNNNNEQKQQQKPQQQQQQQKEEDNNKNNDIDTTIIISTSLDSGGGTTPNAPKIIEVLESIEEYVDGISINQIPIIIAIDGQDNNEYQMVYDINMKTLHSKYSNTAYNNIQILEGGNKKYYLTGTIKRAIDLITTKYIYILYQQIPFTYEFNHNKLIQSMKELNPKNQLRCIKFLDGNVDTNNQISKCKEGIFQHDGPIFESTTNGLTFYQSNSFFDSNQLTTKSYYKEVLGLLGDGLSERSSIAESMAYIATTNCTFWGQSIYPASKKPKKLRRSKNYPF